MEFAVQVKDLDTPGKARWVLGVDPVGERLLITHDDRSLHWVPLQDCKFVKASTPDTPRLVQPVKEARDGPTLAIPSLSQMRGGS